MARTCTCHVGILIAMREYNGKFALRGLSGLVLSLAANVLLCSSVSAQTAARPPGALPAAPTTTYGTPINYQVNGSAATITQTAPTNVVNWDSFNIGSAASVNIVQPTATSVLLNKINSVSLTPTTIDGMLKANGRVYLYDPNGVIFGSTAQVNVNSLIASSLKFDESRVTGGLTLPGATPVLGVDPSYPGVPGNVTVESGAMLTANGGGFIMLAAPGVTNNGLLSAPDGQVILAAGSKVYLAAPPTGQTALRGLLVEVSNDYPAGTAATTATVGTSTAENGTSGQISVGLGNATMIGYAVNQKGLISATTSVSLNGSIYLRARDQATQADGSGPAARSGNLVLGENSVTEVLPTSDTSTIAAASTFNKSDVELDGANIQLQQNASVIAPGGNVTINARNLTQNAVALKADGTPDPAAATAPRVDFASGSLVDVSGSAGTLQPAASSDGTSNYNLDQLNAAGGTVNIRADGAIIQRAGSTINVNGGNAEYPSGNLASGYHLQGGNAGTVKFSAPILVLQGALSGQAGQGDPTAVAAQGGQLQIGNVTDTTMTDNGINPGNIPIDPVTGKTGTTAADVFGYTGNLQIGANATPIAAPPDAGAAFDPASLLATGLHLDPEVLALAGFNRITALTSGNINVTSLAPDSQVWLGSGQTLNSTVTGGFLVASNSGSQQVSDGVKIQWVNLYNGRPAANELPSLTPTTECPANTICTPVTIALTGRASDGKNGATITQTDATNIVSWDSFNIGSNAILTINQPSSTSVLLNKVSDLSLSQTVIDGILNANGRVYIYNPNGILFGKGATVNVNSLIASSLKFDENRVVAGLLLPGQAPVLGADPATYAGIGSGPGDVTVEGNAGGGAVLTSNNGGSIVLAAPTIVNDGTLSVSEPNGQVILAAGSQVYLASPDVTQTGTNLRGLQVEVSNNLPDGSVGASTAENGNSGHISVGQGNATLIGYAVTQNGSVSALTSVNLNGSIYLYARDQEVPKFDGTFDNFSPNGLLDSATRSGNLVLGPNSITDVLPTLSDAATISATAAFGTNKSFNPSVVNLDGANIQLRQNASIVAPGGNVSIKAEQLYVPGAIVNVIDPTAATAPRVDFGAGSLIDVSGSTGTVLAMESNVMMVNLRGTELADNVLLRNSSLYGSNVYVDIRHGTAIANISGYLDLLQYNLGQLTAAGGSVNVSASGAIIQRPGSAINVNGGYVDYASGYVNTTQLMQTNGNLVDIGSATANTLYSLPANQPANGPGNFEQGYRQGSSAGLVALSAPILVLQGGLSSQTTVGPLQRDVTQKEFLTSTENLTANFTNVVFSYPQGGMLMINNSNNTPGYRGSTSDLLIGATATESLAPDVGASFASGSPLIASMNLDSAALALAGFSRISATTSGSISVNDPVTLAAGGSLSLVASQSTENLSNTRGDIQLGAPVTIPGGTLTVKASGKLLVADGVSFDLAGLWTNDQTLASPVLDANGNPVSARVKKGGALKLSAGQLLVGNNVSADVSAGAWLDNNGKTTLGSAGSITFSAVPFNLQTSYDAVLQLGTGLNLSAYGFPTAGSFAGSGGTLNLVGRNVYVGIPPPSASASDLWLQPEFFQTGGFTSYNVAANVDFNVLANTVVNPLASSWQFNQGNNLLSSGAMTAVATNYQFNPSGPSSTRPFTSVAFSATSTSCTAADASVCAGTLVVNDGAKIVLDPGASLSLSASQQLTELGMLDAPAGNIKLDLIKGAATVPGTQVYTRSIWFGPNAQILANGSLQDIYTNGAGISSGSVLDGGSIRIGGGIDPSTGLPLAADGYIIAEKGSVFNVNGTGALGLNFKSNGVIAPPQNVASSGGSIEIRAAEGLLFDGLLEGGAGGAGAAGGSLTVALDPTGVTPTSDPGNSLNTSIPGSPSTAWVLTILPNLTASQRIVPKTLLPGSASAADVQAVKNGTTAIVFDKISGTKKNIKDLGWFIDGSGPGANAKYADQGWISTTSFAGGGFGNIDFKSKDVLAFGLGKSDLALSASNSLILDAPNLSAYNNATNNAVMLPLSTSSSSVKHPSYTLTLTSPYIELGSADPTYQVPFASSTGNSQLTAKGTTIDLIGNSALQGFGAENLNAQADIRLVGVSSLLDANGNDTGQTQGSLAMIGNLNLTDTQTYPTSLSNYAFMVAGNGTDAQTGTMTFSSNNNTPQQPVLSAGGSLTVIAPHIIQAGLVEAPFGSITLGNVDNTPLSATLSSDGITYTSSNNLILFGSVTLGNLIFPNDPLYPSNTPVSNPILTADLTYKTGSVTSVAGSGVVPFGAVNNGSVPASSTWMNGILLQSLPLKSIISNAQTISANSGSLQDLSGGGALLAYEFTPGKGGSRNVLDNSTRGTAAMTFAISPNPNIQGAVAPIDNVYGTDGLKPGDSVYLSAMPGGLPAGNYTLLPAQYALLPGYYSISLAANSSNMQAGSNTKLADGSMLVAGQSSASVFGSRSTLSKGFIVSSSGAAVPTLNDVVVPSLSGTVVTTLYPNINGVIVTTLNGKVVPNINGVVDPSIDTLNGVVVTTLNGKVIPNINDALVVSNINGVVDPTIDTLNGVVVTTLNGTVIPNIQSDGWTLSPGTVVGSKSEIALYYATNFFSSKGTAAGVAAPELPVDGGHIVFDATGTSSSALTLNSTINLNAATGGRAGMADISAPQIDVVSTASQGGAGNAVTLTADYLNNLGADSLWLGAVRNTANGSWVDYTNNVTLSNDAQHPLSAPAIVIMANNNITLDSGAVLQSGGTLGRPTGNISSTSGGEAMLRVSSGGPVTVARTNPAANTGTLDIANGATVSASGSATLDAPGGVTLNGTLDMASGSALSLGSPGISLGSAIPTTNTDLQLGTAELLTLSGLSSLTLNSYASTINLYGTVNLGNTATQLLSFQGAGFQGNGGSVNFVADTVSLAGYAASTAAPSSASSGLLTIQANTVAIGNNAFAIRGYANTDLIANRVLRAVGTSGQLVVDQNLTLNAGLIDTASAASASYKSYGIMTLTQVANPVTPLSAPGMGGQLNFSAANIVDSAQVDAPSGKVVMTGTNGVDISGGQITTAGNGVVFGSTTAYAPGGTIALSGSEVTVKNGAILDVSAVGASAGTLLITAGAVNIANTPDTLKGGAVAGIDGVAQTQGQFSLYTNQAGTSDWFGTLNTQLKNAGFTGALQFSFANGDVTLASNDNIIAHQVVIAANNGSININGTIDASGAEGGSISLYASQPTYNGSSGNVTLSGNLLACATTGTTCDLSSLLQIAGGTPAAAGSTGKGGQVTIGTGFTGISTLSAVKGSSISLLSGGSIDVGGSNANGSVTLRAPRVSTDGIHYNDVAIAGLGSNIKNSLATVIEAYQVYQAGTIMGTDATTNNQPANFNTANNLNLDPSTNGVMFTDAKSFMSNQAANLASQARLGLAGNTGISLRPGIEVQSAGNLTVSVNEFAANPADRGWNLDAWRFGPDNVPIMLTLRAAGNLDIIGSISDGFVKPLTSDLNSGTAMPDWSLGADTSASYRFAGGAALTAANPLAVNAGSGGVIFGFADRTPPKVITTQVDTTMDSSGNAVPVTETLAWTSTAPSVVSGNYLTSSDKQSQATANALLTPTDAPVALVRTGTGNINIASGGDVTLAMAPFFVFNPGINDKYLANYYYTPVIANYNGAPVVSRTQNADGSYNYTAVSVDSSGRYAASVYGATVYTAGQSINLASSGFTPPKNQLNIQYGASTGLLTDAAFGAGGGAITVGALGNVYGPQNPGNIYREAGTPYSPVDPTDPTSTETKATPGKVVTQETVPQLVNDWLFRQGRTYVGANGTVQFEQAGLNIAARPITNVQLILNAQGDPVTDMSDPAVAAAQANGLTVNTTTYSANGKTVTVIYGFAQTLKVDPVAAALAQNNNVSMTIDSVSGKYLIYKFAKNISDPVAAAVTQGMTISMVTDTSSGVPAQYVSYLYEFSPIKTAWWTRYDYFNAGIATFGGGDVRVNAAGNVSDLSANVATNAYTPGASPASLTEQGGGNLLVRAGGNILGGSFYVQNGMGTLRADGSIKAGDFVPVSANSAPPMDTILALGNATFNVTAGGSVAIETAYNPMLTEQSVNNVNSNGSILMNVDETDMTQRSVDIRKRLAQFSNFSTYDVNKSSVNLTAVGGDLKLSNDATTLAVAGNNVASYYNTTGGFASDYNLYLLEPARFSAAALSGNLTSFNRFTLAPAQSGQLKLLAAGTIDLSNGGVSPAPEVLMLDMNPATLSSSAAPQLFTTSDIGVLSGTATGIAAHMSGGLHTGDTQPVEIVALKGDIVGNIDKTSTLTLPKFAEILAGNNIVDLGFSIQQNSTADVTTITAGNDFFENTAAVMAYTDPGQLKNIVTGPGSIDISAGRNVDFGNRGGLVTRGNLENPYLPVGGAAINIVAGVKPQAVNYAQAVSWLAQYGSVSDVSTSPTTLTPSEQNDLIAYLQSLNLNKLPASSLTSSETAFLGLSAAQQSQTPAVAVAAFLSLPAAQQSPFYVTHQSAANILALQTFVGMTEQNALTAYLQTLQPNMPTGLTSAKALDAFNSLTTAQQNQFLVKFADLNDLNVYLNANINTYAKFMQQGQTVIALASTQDAIQFFAAGQNQSAAVAQLNQYLVKSTNILSVVGLTASAENVWAAFRTLSPVDQTVFLNSHPDVVANIATNAAQLYTALGVQPNFTSFSPQYLADLRTFVNNTLPVTSALPATTSAQNVWAAFRLLSQTEQTLFLKNEWPAVFTALGVQPDFSALSQQDMLDLRASVNNALPATATLPITASVQSVWAAFQLLSQADQTRFLYSHSDVVTSLIASASQSSAVATIQPSTTRVDGNTAQLNASFFSSLSEASNQSSNSNFDRLVASLFPSASTARVTGCAGGCIDVYSSQIKTEQNGSINLFAPNGSVYAGLTTGTSGKSASTQGIFTIAGGAVAAVVNNDLLVNQGRVFTLGGGDITLVSEYNNIDAGKGSKTASSAPPPQITISKDGQVAVDVSGSIAGSGIATLKTNPAVPAGNVYLIAPRGTVNAGDAGVRSSGNIIVNAAVVLNGNNFAAAGLSSGTTAAVVAPSTPPPPPPASTTSSSSDASKSLSNANAASLNAALNVEVVGYGDNSRAPNTEPSGPSSDGIREDATPGDGASNDEDIKKSNRKKKT